MEILRRIIKIIEGKESVNTWFDLFKLAEEFGYKPTKEILKKMITYHLNSTEGLNFLQTRFINYIKYKYPEYFNEIYSHLISEINRSSYNQIY